MFSAESQKNIMHCKLISLCSQIFIIYALPGRLTDTRQKQPISTLTPLDQRRRTSWNNVDDQPTLTTSVCREEVFSIWDSVFALMWITQITETMTCRRLFKVSWFPWFTRMHSDGFGCFQYDLILPCRGCSYHIIFNDQSYCFCLSNMFILTQTNFL